MCPDGETQTLRDHILGTYVDPFHRLVNNSGTVVQWHNNTPKDLDFILPRRRAERPSQTPNGSEFRPRSKMRRSLSARVAALLPQACLNTINTNNSFGISGNPEYGTADSDAFFWYCKYLSASMVLPIIHEIADGTLFRASHNNPSVRTALDHFNSHARAKQPGIHTRKNGYRCHYTTFKKVIPDVARSPRTVSSSA
jgi:hypothetical protein